MNTEIHRFPATEAALRQIINAHEQMALDARSEESRAAYLQVAPAYRGMLHNIEQGIEA